MSPRSSFDRLRTSGGGRLDIRVSSAARHYTLRKRLLPLILPALASYNGPTSVG
jgi:hypothetical protein